MKKGLRKIAKLTPMNTRFQRGAVEIILDLIKGLSQLMDRILHLLLLFVEIILDLIKGLSPETTIFPVAIPKESGNHIRPD